MSANTSPLQTMLDDIAAFFADVDDDIKVMKIGEELGEAVQARIGMLGANVRKGVTHTSLDLQHELADIAITAYTALSAFSGSPFKTLEERAAYVIDRLDIQGTVAA